MAEFIFGRAYPGSGIDSVFLSNNGGHLQRRWSTTTRNRTLCY